MHCHPAIGARRPTDALVQHTQWFSPEASGRRAPPGDAALHFGLALLISFLVMLLMGRVPSFTFPLSVSFRYLFSLYILPTLHVLTSSFDIELIPRPPLVSSCLPPSVPQQIPRGPTVIPSGTTLSPRRAPNLTQLASLQNIPRNVGDGH